MQWASARGYHQTEARWLSPDPAGMAAVDPMNPQSWNRYAYVGNNPVTSVDPSGLRPTDPADGALCGAGKGGEYDCHAPHGVDGMADPVEAQNSSYTQGWTAFGSNVGSGFDHDYRGQVERSYASWVDAVWRAGGSEFTSSNGVPIRIGWTVDGGVFGTNLVNGATFSAASLEELIGPSTVTGAANNPTSSTSQPWPSKDPSSCSVYGSGNLLNFVCKNAGTTPYANSARGCLQSYWDPGTGTCSMTQGGPGVPWKPIDQAQSVVSFVNSHAVCLVGSFFY